MEHYFINSNNMPYRVLIVDDNPYHRVMEKEILSDSRYILTEAMNGNEALEILKTQDFDVVLLDKRMPGMDGDKLCHCIRNELNLSLLPVIMVTGSNSCEDMSNSMQAGANDFIRKPYDPTELIMRINTAAYQKRLTDQLDSTESLLFALARMVEAKDSHTGDHCSRLSHTAVVFGEALGLSGDDLLNLRRGGVLHDIGKMGVPDSILLNPNRLTDEEWKVMHQHTLIGAHLCSELKTLQKTIPIIRNHHECYNGTGYPDKLSGNEIPFLARVFQIVDIYDALAHERPYKKALPTQAIISILKEEMEKGRRDPELTPVFLNILQTR
ncbi:MAG: response regulator, partial [Gammaproteobacteria bacterium]|nr:response regulator [Gammaproteobacteria bacterium]